MSEENPIKKEYKEFAMSRMFRLDPGCSRPEITIAPIKQKVVNKNE